MANHVRRQIRDAAVTALTGLTTTGTRVYDSRVYPMQDANLPGLRIFTNNETVEISSLGVGRLLDRQLELVVEACVKENDSFDNTVDLIIKEVETALASGLTGAKYVQLKQIEIEMAGDGEKPVAMARMTFDAPYITVNGTPDTAL
jgi:hypothetical protein